MRTRSAGRLAGFAAVIGLALTATACGVSTSTSPPTPSPSPAVTPSAEVASTMPSNEPTPSASPAPTAGPFILTSDAFTEGGAIPTENSCDGADTSPALAWSAGPSGTVSFALVMDDPDAGGFVHWVVFDMGADTTALPAGVPLPAGGGPPQGTNSFGNVGYGGPCPPSGTHHYRFRLLALDARLSLSGAPKASQVLATATGHILGETTLTATYRRH